MTFFWTGDLILILSTGLAGFCNGHQVFVTSFTVFSVVSSEVSSLVAYMHSNDLHNYRTVWEYLQWHIYLLLCWLCTPVTIITFKTHNSVGIIEQQNHTVYSIFSNIITNIALSISRKLFWPRTDTAMYRAH